MARTALLSGGLLLVTGELLSTGPESWLSIAVPGALGFSFAINLYLVRLLWRGRFVRGVGAAGAIFDGLLVLLFMGLALWAGLEDGLSPAFVFKTELPVAFIFLIIINGLTLHPRYPLVVGGAATAALLGAMALLLADLRPPSRRTEGPCSKGRLTMQARLA